MCCRFIIWSSLGFFDVYSKWRLAVSRRQQREQNKRWITVLTFHDSYNFHSRKDVNHSRLCAISLELVYISQDVLVLNRGDAALSINAGSSIDMVRNTTTMSIIHLESMSASNLAENIEWYRMYRQVRQLVYDEWPSLLAVLKSSVDTTRNQKPWLNPCKTSHPIVLGSGDGQRSGADRVHLVRKTRSRDIGSMHVAERKRAVTRFWFTNTEHLLFESIF